MTRPFLSPWRAQGQHAAMACTDAFDEVVVSDWLHVETMNRGHVWMRIGPLMINVTRRRGVTRIRIEQERDEDGYEILTETWEEWRRARLLAAYEVARQGDARKAPGAERLRLAVAKMGAGY